MAIKPIIQSMIAKANQTTGEADTDLTSAIQSLVDGFGQGGGEFHHASGTIVSTSAASIQIDVSFEPKIIAVIVEDETYSVGLNQTIGWFGYKDFDIIGVSVSRLSNGNLSALVGTTQFDFGSNCVTLIRRSSSYSIPIGVSFKYEIYG